MRLPPPEVTSQWPKPNYVDPVRRGHALTIVQLILVLLGTIFVAMRLYARLVITRARIGLDDVLIVLAWVFSVGLTATVILATQRFGWDLHIWDVPLTAQVTGRKLSWCGQIFYTVASNLAKTSILVFYLRILVARVDKIITKLALAGVVGYFTSIIFVVFLQCRPFGYYWNILIPGNAGKGKCINETSGQLAAASINLIFDVIIFIIPLRSLILLKIRFTQRMHVLALFSAGLLVIVAASIRLYYVTIIFIDTWDVTWFGYVSWLWTAVEIHIGIICACVPSCRALLVSWSERISSKGTKSYGPGTTRTYNHIDEDVRGLTIGNRTNVMAGSIKSGDSGVYSSDSKSKGVRVQMEVMQYEENYVEANPKGTRNK
ncbi:hypothetical protein V493_02762 [Pseudogymnoascus sp. VKM F-4281 (FW-2241)]|nr:hypothetical protein V493_02762 [Pseudogymnoascus sp. VKM F-4281 (FW-2241)]